MWSQRLVIVCLFCRGVCMLPLFQHGWRAEVPTAEQQEILIKGGSSAPRSGVLYLTAFNQRERTMRAIKVLAIAWGGALVALFIPLAHFVLVPAFLIAGPVMAYLRYRVTETAENVRGACPVCEKEVTIAVGGNERPPVWTYCPECQAPINISGKMSANER